MEIKAASLPACLSHQDINSSERDEEEEPLTPLFGLSDMWQGRASTATQDAYKAMAVPSMDISTCVGSDIDPESFNYSLGDSEELGTSFMDQASHTCVTYAMSEGGSSFVDEGNDIDDMYDHLETCSHLHPERANESRTPSRRGLRALLKNM